MISYDRYNATRPTTRVHINAGDFLADAKQLRNHVWPEAFAGAITIVAMSVKKVVQQQTRDAFHLHGEWIPKNITMYPSRRSQIKSMARSANKTGECFATVGLSKHLKPYMPMHEYGAIKHPDMSRGHNTIAIPNYRIMSRFFTSTGKTKSIYLPKNLLKNYNSGTRTKGSTSLRNAFILGRGTQNFSMIMRNKAGGGLEMLYFFYNKPKIRPTWKFEESGKRFLDKHATALTITALERFCGLYHNRTGTMQTNLLPMM